MLDYNDSEGPQQSGHDSTRDAETLKILRRRAQALRPSFRILVMDAALGVALGILVIVVVSLMVKPLQWVMAGLAGH